MNKNFGMILRLAYNAVLAVWWASSYMNESYNIFRLHEKGGRISIIVPFLLIDTLFTLMWEKKVLYSIHLGLHIGTGWIFYIILVLDQLNVGTVGLAGLLFLFIGIIMMLFGIIPFTIYKAGRKMTEDPRNYVSEIQEGDA